MREVNGSALGKYELLPTEQLTVVGVEVSNPTKFPGARIKAILQTGSGQQVSSLSFVDLPHLNPSAVRDAFIEDTGLQTMIPNGGDRTLSRGMSWVDVRCLEGVPESENDYDDDRQLVYDNGHTIIYIDGKTDRVTNITHFK